MGTDNQKIIHSMINSQWLLERENAHKHADPGHIVTISRQCGAFGEGIARHIAKQLEVPYFDKRLVEEIAKSAGVDTDLFRQLEQKIHRIKPTWLETAFSDRPWLQAKYSKNLFSVLLGISRVGGVILGRGANLVLGKSACFRLRIVAPFPMRVARLSDRLELDSNSAEETVKKIDLERAHFIESIYGADIDNPANYDLVVNTERFDIETAAQLTLTAAKVGHFCLHPHTD
jgi:cytidylate kinase